MVDPYRFNQLQPAQALLKSTRSAQDELRPEGPRKVRMLPIDSLRLDFWGHECAMWLCMAMG